MKLGPATAGFLARDLCCLLWSMDSVILVWLNMEHYQSNCIGRKESISLQTKHSTWVRMENGEEHHGTVRWSVESEATLLLRGIYHIPNAYVAIMDIMQKNHYIYLARTLESIFIRTCRNIMALTFAESTPFIWIRDTGTLRRYQ